MVEPASMVGAMRHSEPDERDREEAGLNSLIERRACEASQREDADERGEENFGRS